MNNLIIVVPCYNEEENIHSFTKNIWSVLCNIKRYDLIFVDDGSTDSTLEILKSLSKEHTNVSYISLSRNFGHQAALKAGLDAAKGDAVICMDADLQHPPELIPQLISKWKEGYDIVNTCRKPASGEKFSKRVTSKLYYRLLNKLSDIKVDQGSADFRLLDRKVVDTLKEMPEYHLFFRGQIPWIGFKQTSISYTAESRYAGSTKYSAKKMIVLALNGITGFSVKPLKLALVAGGLFALIAMLYGIYAILMALCTDKTIEGWTSVIASVLFLSGINLIVLGIMGEYIGKMFMEVKRRPHYIISETNIGNKGIKKEPEL